MPLYQCTKCGAVENTALANFWSTKDKSKILCSECDPEIGKWHGRFPKKNAFDDGYHVDVGGLSIYGPTEVDTDKMEWKYNRTTKIKGRVPKIP